MKTEPQDYFKTLSYIDSVVDKLLDIRDLVSRDMISNSHWVRLSEKPNSFPPKDLYNGTERWSIPVLAENCDGSHFVAKYDYDNREWREATSEYYIGDVVAWRCIAKS